ncbi:hypothetical protein HFX_1800 [Haloferax mediterranei ATCC 33500]|uniref:Uncharacterized protein n=1 Tax=Haloferax mediterranei (strain ATCC 33500 / DSM 1411 / JCM 8866 / NBRC 14739 / NCIMB 2177 / R-4) TaxID=523841 RepID=I3R5J3_HALMT|nr:hypothetical protein HFX_1800 [Haloferax mediterranei ATCC 33500]
MTRASALTVSFFMLSHGWNDSQRGLSHRIRSIALGVYPVIWCQLSPSLQHPTDPKPEHHCTDENRNRIQRPRRRHEQQRLGDDDSDEQADDSLAGNDGHAALLVTSVTRSLDPLVTVAFISTDTPGR